VAGFLELERAEAHDVIDHLRENSVLKPDPANRASKLPTSTSEPPVGASQPPVGTSQPPVGTSEPPTGAPPAIRARRDPAS
jgi:hypothetical protein